MVVVAVVPEGNMFLVKILSMLANWMPLLSVLGFPSLLLCMSGSKFQGQNIACPAK